MNGGGNQEEQVEKIKGLISLLEKPNYGHFFAIWAHGGIAYVR